VTSHKQNGGRFVMNRPPSTFAFVLALIPLLVLAIFPMLFALATPLVLTLHPMLFTLLLPFNGRGRSHRGCRLGRRSWSRRRLDSRSLRKGAGKGREHYGCRDGRKELVHMCLLRIYPMGERLISLAHRGLYSKLGAITRDIEIPPLQAISATPAEP
jgi:hypothetical protein